MPRKRANGEGSIYELPERGLWAASLTIQLDPATGKPKRRTIYGKTQAEVRKKLDALKRLREENALSSPDKTTVEEWSAEWLKHVRQHVRPKTYEGYELWTRRYMLPHIGRVRLEKLTGRDIQQMLDTLSLSYKPRSVQYVRTLTGIMLGYAVMLGVLPRNPVQATRASRVVRKEMSFWTPQQVRVFLTLTSGHRLEALFFLAVITGMRKSELLGLRWQDIGLDRLTVREGVVLLHGKPHQAAPKTEGSKRDIILSPDVFEHLRRRRDAWEAEREAAGESWEGQELLFGTLTGGPMNPWNLDHTWIKLRAASGLPSIRFHDLRHTNATLAIARGTDIRTLSERLGHAHPHITLDVYGHVLDEQRRKAAMSMDDLLGTAAGTATGKTPGE